MPRPENTFRREFQAQHPHPGTDPVRRLQHTVAIFDGPDDEWVVIATDGVYSRGEKTGLTSGDLRALAAQTKLPAAVADEVCTVISDWFGGSAKLYLDKFGHSMPIGDIARSLVVELLERGLLATNPPTE